MNLKKLMLLLFIGANFHAQVFPQETKPVVDSSRINDSLNAIALKEYNLKLKKIEKQRIQDSIKKAELEKQLSELKTTDNIKKEELLKQLEDINAKEAKRIEEKKAKIESMKAKAKGYSVNDFYHKELFVIYNKLGSFSAKDRAIAIEKRMENLADDYDFHPDSLTIFEDETTVDVMYGESIIVTISENDALWYGVTKKELAEKYKGLIGDAVMEYKNNTSWSTILKEIGLTILVLLVVGVIIYYVLKIFRWTAKKIANEEGKKIKGFKIGNYTLFDEKRELAALLFLNKIAKWFSIIIIGYFTLPILFGIYPRTKHLADRLSDAIFNPIKKFGVNFWHYLPNLFTIIVIIILFRYVIKFCRFLKDEIEAEKLRVPGFYTDWANPTFQIVKVIFIAFAIVLIFPYLPGSDSPIFQGVTVFLGFLFTFGSAGSLSNIIAGLVLTYMRLFAIGDRVKIGDVVGDVIEKAILVTRIRTIKNEIISIPNSIVMNSHTINFSSDAPDKGLIMHTTVTIGYDVPWKKIEAALLEAANRTDLLLKDPKPFVLQTSLEDFYVAYQLNAYTKDPNKQAVIYSNLHANIQDACNEVGIEILSPHYRAARDGNMTTIPENYLDANYKAPSFNVHMNKDAQ